MQTDTCSRTTEFTHLAEEVCLLCGTAVPPLSDGSGRPAEEHLQDLGWHCWHSRVRLAPGRCLDSSLRLCPRCLADPMLVATTLLQRHGLAHMEEWLRSMDFLPDDGSDAGRRDGGSG